VDKQTAERLKRGSTVHQRTRKTLVELLRGSRSERLDYLVTVAIVLGLLLVVLNALTLLGNVLDVLGRFQQQIFLFVIGALIAYLLIPLVGLVQRAVRLRWAAIASSYVLVFLAAILFGVLLLNPFISQAQSLAKNLRNPAAASLQRLQTVRKQTSSIETTVQHQQQRVSRGQSIPRQTEQQTQQAIAALQHDLATLSTSSSPLGQIQIPPSYVTPIQTPVNRLASAYQRATRSAGTTEVQALDQAVAAAKAAASAATTSYDQAAATPILVLSAQTWLDQHGITVNIHNQFGSALQQLSKQLSSILNNALGIALQAGNLLLNTVLVLIISVYFVADGSRFVGWLIGLAPTRSRPRVRYFVNSLNHTLGSYLRTQIVLAALAGTLDSTGALVFGVPYAIVIFFSSFFLSLIPVIGPVVLYIPPMIIALLFTKFPTPLFYLPWLLVGEQLVTNVIGPRLQGHNVGIHPLEAMAAALLGYPLFGILGAFFAVPMVAFLHVVVRQAVHSARHDGDELDGMPPTEEQTSAASSVCSRTPPT
jgi:predicted PurR-regulated permease PerM